MITERLDPQSFYYTSVRKELLPLLAGERGVIVDVGCGAGELLAWLKKSGAQVTIGIEFREEVARDLRDSGRVDRVLHLDLERDALPLSAGSIDVIIASHVLEHLIDPWRVLRELAVLLKPGGRLVGALPNVRHAKVVLNLALRGRWRYADAGILDRTHLRFFTRESVESMLNDAGFQVEALLPEIGSRKERIAARLTFGLCNDLLAYAYNFRCVKRV